ncbi:hypothetical protein BN1012_Phect2043 [Candidatus Phaeomarinobacter ectocarpi]|uniref:Uncharacterized protein n=1 Tax=Candidatus Phaeomarinibacter ectocarpi TaxID=1458461 RepID=X5MNN6_9HYPH|nr:hypothetical protein BN1012_Phect2043 [Candidatus Phaeomarinobacter ectocarpi]
MFRAAIGLFHNRRARRLEGMKAMRMGLADPPLTGPGHICRIARNPAPTLLT